MVRHCSDSPALFDSTAQCNRTTRYEGERGSRAKSRRLPARREQSSQASSCGQAPWYGVRSAQAAKRGHPPVQGWTDQSRKRRGRPRRLAPSPRCPRQEEAFPLARFIGVSSAAFTRSVACWVAIGRSSGAAGKRRQRPGVLMGAAQVKKRRCSAQEAPPLSRFIGVSLDAFVYFMACWVAIGKSSGAAPPLARFVGASLFILTPTATPPAPRPRPATDSAAAVRAAPGPPSGP